MFLSVGTVVCGKRTLLPSRHHSGPLRFPPSQLASRQPQPPLDLLGHFLTAAGEAAYSRYTCAAGGRGRDSTWHQKAYSGPKSCMYACNYEEDTKRAVHAV